MCEKERSSKNFFGEEMEKQAWRRNNSHIHNGVVCYTDDVAIVAVPDRVCYPP